MRSPRPFVFAPIAASVLALGCAKSPPAAGASPEPAEISQLASMSGRTLVVLPVQYLSWSPGASARDELVESAEAMNEVDEAIASELRGRGIRAWIFAPQVSEFARKSGGLTADPHKLDAMRLRRIRRASDVPLGQPLASQVRSLVTLGDSRYVLVPVELRLESRAGLGRGLLSLYLIDTRTSRVVWIGEAATEADPAYAARSILTPVGVRAVAQAVASKLADMVVAP